MPDMQPGSFKGTARNLFLNIDHRVALALNWLRRKLGFRGVALLAFATFRLGVGVVAG
jgi:hypothetical protein